MSGVSSTRSRVGGLWKGVLLSLIILLIVGHAGGGWYYAGQIAEGAFEVDRTEEPPDVEVVSADGDLLTLRPVGEASSDLTSPGVFGFRTADGYSRLTDLVEVAADRVVRRFQVVTGSAPRAGSLGSIDASVFPDPAAAGLEVEEVTYPSPLGPMAAWLTAGSRSTFVVQVHGRGASRTEALRLMRALDSQGYPQLVVTYRNDPGQPSDPSGLYQFGRTEWEDLEAAVDYVMGLGARRVVVVGYSMGGAIAVSYLYRQGRGPVVAGVLDSPALSLSDAVDFAASRRKVLGLPLPPSLTGTAKLIAGLRLGVDWEAIDYVERADLLAVPVLVIHGT